MNRSLSILGILLFILTISKGCEKDYPKYISIDCKLVDQYGNEKSTFNQKDSIVFEFYLSNYSCEVATYLRPCLQFGNYLNVYRKEADGNYIFYGRPNYYCPAVAIWDSIYDGVTLLVTKIIWTEKLEWPERKPGKYYVGDTLSLSVNSDLMKTYKRIYFEIE